MAKEKCAAVPIIFLTGQGDQKKAVEVMKAGVAHYLMKSRLSVEDLERAIRNEKEQRNRAETALRAQDRLLNGVSKATNKLLTVPDYNVSLAQALEILGDAAHVDGTFIFKHSQNADSLKEWPIGYYQ